MGPATLETDECTQQFHKLILRRQLLLLASQCAYPKLLRSNMLLMCAFIDQFPTWPHTGPGVLQVGSTPKAAAVFQVYVSKPCSGFSCIQITLQQSFRYPKLAAVFQVFKPQVTLPSNRINCPWLSKGLLQAMRKRNSLYRQAKSTGNFSDYKRQVVSQLRLAKKAFFHKINLKNSVSIANRFVSTQAPAF